MWPDKSCVQTVDECAQSEACVTYGSQKRPVEYLYKSRHSLGDCRNMAFVTVIIL